MLEQSRLIAKTVDPKRLYTSVKEVSSFHRIQASTGYRAAAEYCLKTLTGAGIDAQILSYTARPDQWYLSNQMFLEWDLQEAYLYLDDPQIRLADAASEPISVIQRSWSHDFTDGVDLVYLKEGNFPEKYQDLDLKGKLIFVRDEFNGFVDWAIREKGAIGVVTDWINEEEGVRTRYDLYDSRNYTSFWWTGVPEEPECFGFVLSPRLGDQLADLCEKRMAAYENHEADSPYLRCSGKVVSRLYPGHIEVVEATIPGETDEKVCISAHLCHPKCSCNDNASGVAAAMEAMRSLKWLIDRGELPKNRRTIKMILVPEFTGSYAYLHDHTDYQKFVGAINLDMVGGRQTKPYGPITLTGLPYANPSFIEDLTALCMDYANRTLPDMDNEPVPAVNMVRELFAGGSDHIVFADPAIGIPSCMIGQWPDLHYHTATDTLEVIDPNVLAFSCRSAALYAYILSNLDLADMREVQNLAHISLQNRLSGITTDALRGKVTSAVSAARLKYIEEFYTGAARDFRRVLPDCDEQVEKEVAWIQETIRSTRHYLDLDNEQGEVTTQNDKRVFKRNYSSPLHRVAHNAAAYPDSKETLKQYLQLYKEFGHRGYTIETLTQFYTNGKRTVDEIVERVLCDTGVADCRVLMDVWFSLLEQIGLIEEV